VSATSCILLLCKCLQKLFVVKITDVYFILYAECTSLFQFMQFMKQLSNGSAKVKDNEVLVKNDVVIGHYSSN